MDVLLAGEGYETGRVHIRNIHSIRMTPKKPLGCPQLQKQAYSCLFLNTNIVHPSSPNLTLGIGIWGSVWDCDLDLVLIRFELSVIEINMLNCIKILLHCIDRPLAQFRNSVVRIKASGHSRIRRIRHVVLLNC